MLAKTSDKFSWYEAKKYVWLLIYILKLQLQATHKNFRFY